MMIDGKTCPTCRQECASKTGVKIHHKRKHGESIAGIEDECANCGNEITVTPHRHNNYSRNFCDKKCAGEWKAANIVGEAHPNHQKVTIECEWCETTFKASPSELTNDFYTKRFCSRECHSNWRSKHNTGKNNPNWSGRVQFLCKCCGDSFAVKPSREETAKFCSRECKEEYERGESHHAFRNGGKSIYYGPDWESIRRDVLERDNHQCQCCRRHKISLKQPLEVHHIIPIASFDNHREANTLSNLITLCQPCHRRWEFDETTERVLTSPSV